jgi:glutathione synthase
MPTEKLTMAFVMDPIASVDIHGDTTFVFMCEAQRRGHEVLYIDPDQLSIREGRPSALATPVRLQRVEGDHFELGETRRLFLDDEVDVAFQRKDPPVDSHYVFSTQILSLCERTLVLNRPQSVLAHNEKLFALAFRDLMTDTVVTRSVAELREFMEAMGGEMIVKPLDGKGGEGVFHCREGDGNLSSILETATRFGERVAMGQRYLPAVRRGDKRILLLEGKVLGAVLRVPAEAEVRANLHVGARAEKAELSDADLRIIERLEPVLRREGLFFVGIDVIGDHLTEINVTSPTGVQEVNALEDTRLEERVIEAVERRVRETHERD